MTAMVATRTRLFEDSRSQDTWDMPDDHPAVFVVDDDACLRAIIGDWVESAGFRPVRIQDGKSCLSALSIIRPAAVLLDLHMDGLSGIETLERIRAIEPGVPVIALTGEQDPEVSFGLVEVGASELLLKPVTRAQLVRALVALVSGPALRVPA
jgi:DNA-binding response OmpR family regulator